VKAGLPGIGSTAFFLSNKNGKIMEWRFILMREGFMLTGGREADFLER